MIFSEQPRNAKLPLPGAVSALGEGGSILEILQSPLFMAYHNGQPFNKNHLRPCPMLENPELLRKMVHETGAHSTDLQSPESVDLSLRQVQVLCRQLAAHRRRDLVPYQDPREPLREL